MRIAAVAALALAFAGSAAVPAGAEKAPPPPLVFSEKLVDRIVVEDGFADVLTTVKIKATFTVPYDVGTLGEPGGTTLLSVFLGDYAFEDEIEDAFKFVPGKSAKWVRRDDFTGRVVETVTATWKDGILKVVLKTNGEDSAYATLYWLEDLAIEEEELAGTLAFGTALFDIAGTFGGTASTRTVAKGQDEFDLAKVVLAGTAEATEDPDIEDPFVEVLAPLDFDEFESFDDIVLEIVVTDDRSLASLTARVDSGGFQVIPFTVNPDPVGGGVKAEVFHGLGGDGTGDFVLTVTATDAAGNESTVTVNFSVVPPPE